jgi:hydroxylamine reductase
MLPAHGYPGLHKHAALAGNYGGAWYKQKAEFSAFPGPILMTTNCIMPPPASYADRIFTTGEVGVSGSPHLEGSPVAAGAAAAQRKDFTPLIEAAKRMPGFSAADAAAEPKFVTTGFGHEATLGAAGLVLDAMKAGELKHIFLVGGCDAPEPSRKVRCGRRLAGVGISAGGPVGLHVCLVPVKLEVVWSAAHLEKHPVAAGHPNHHPNPQYYTEVVKGLPQDTMVLTLGCGKYRFYDQDLGTLPSGLPRLLDMGQCNDAYSAIVVASKLAEALGVSINELPLSLDISWFEQKAVAVLLTLLSLGVKNIRLGPNLPAFLTPGAVAYLQEAFNIMPADTRRAKEEVARMMAAEGEVDAKNASVATSRGDVSPLPRPVETCQSPYITKCCFYTQKVLEVSSLP